MLLSSVFCPLTSKSKMPTDFVFRLSTYLTLALSCACVGYSERAFLPEVPFIAAAVIVTLVVLFRLETRVPLLSIPDANRLGLVVGLVYFGWAVLRVVREFKNPTLPNLEWQLLIVALFGPLLMTVMPAKLRGAREARGDFWWLTARRWPRPDSAGHRGRFDRVRPHRSLRGLRGLESGPALSSAGRG